MMSEAAGPSRSAALGGMQVWKAMMPAWIKPHATAAGQVLMWLPVMHFHILLCPAVPWHIVLVDM